MSESIFETFTDERGNISVRISQEVQVLTREEANRIEAEYRRMQAENAKLRELVRDAWGDGHPDRSCEGCDIRDECHDDVERMRKDGVLRFSSCLFELRIEERMRELGIEVTA